VPTARSKLASPALKVASRNAQRRCAPHRLNAAEGSFKRWLACFERAACRTLNVNEVNYERCAATLSVREADFERWRSQLGT